MGQLIKYSGSIAVISVLLLIIYKALVEQGILKNDLKENRKAKDFINTGTQVLIMQAVIFFVGFTAYQFIKGKKNFFSINDIWLYGDSKIITDLASGWYKLGDYSTAGIMPLFPYLQKLLGQVMQGSYFLAGIVLSILSLIFAAYYLYQLLRLDYDDTVIRNSFKFFLFFPFIFVMFLAVPDSLFLCLSMSALYYMRKANWLPVSISIFLSVLCDIRGVFLILPVIYESFRTKHQIPDKILTVLSAPLGLLAVTGFMNSLYGRSFAFMEHTATGYNIFSLINKNDYKLLYGNIIPLIILFSILLAGSFLLLGRIRTSYLLYSIPVCAAPFFTVWLDNRPRFFVSAIPFFIGMGLLSKYKTVNVVITYLSLLFMGLYLFCYINLNMAF